MLYLDHVLELNTWDMFWMNQAQMRQNVVGRRQVEGGLQVLLGLWLMLGVYRISVLGSCISHCLFLRKIWREQERSRFRAV